MPTFLLGDTTLTALMTDEGGPEGVERTLAALSQTTTQAALGEGGLVFLAEMARAAYGTELPGGIWATGMPTAPDGLYVGGLGGSAVALVGRSGDSLFIAFRGTDDDIDIDHWSQLQAYYEFYRPLLDDIAGYIASDPSIRHVYVTGHSLGGAMAQLLATNDGWWPGVDLQVVTFASLGGVIGPDQPDDRITNIVIQQDFIRFASISGVILGDEYIIDDRNSANNGGVYYHSVDNYVAVARYLTEIGIVAPSIYAGNGTADDIRIAANLGFENGAPVLYDYHGWLPPAQAGVDTVFTTRQGGDNFVGGSPLDVANFATDRFTDVFVDVGAGVAVSNAWSAATTFSGIENIITGSGDDTIAGSAASNWLSGGEGLDTVLYQVTRSEAFVATAGRGEVHSVEVYGVVDTLDDIERVQFSDGSLIFGFDPDNAAFAYRIYAAAYGRTPDEAGLRFWTQVLDQRGDGPPETSDKQFVAGFFLTADEFVDLYGQNPSGEQYVAALYQNVLHRSPDQAGYDFWLDQIASGQSRDDMLIWFTDSDENVANTAPDIDDGLWVL